MISQIPFYLYDEFKKIEKKFRRKSGLSCKKYTNYLSKIVFEEKTQKVFLTIRSK